jgi:single-strand DNA-binding protein
MFHRVTIIGRVGQDPEMRYTPSGTPVTSFSVASTSRASKDRPCPQGWKESYNGTHWELTTWWKVSAWRQLAETINQYVHKGMLVFVEGEVNGEAADGSLHPRVWEGRDGITRASFEITTHNVKFLGSADASREDRPAQGEQTAPYDDNDDPF